MEATMLTRMTVLSHPTELAGVERTLGVGSLLADDLRSRGGGGGSVCHGADNRRSRSIIQ